MVVLIVLSSILIVIVIFLYLKSHKNYKIWNQLNIPNLSPSFPFGSFTTLVTKRLHIAVVCKNLYEELKTCSPDGYAGVYWFHKPTLFVTSPEFAKTVLVKDFNNFADRGIYSNERDDPLTRNIFFFEGQQWRTIRSKLAYAFTSNKNKMMFSTLTDVVDRLVEHIHNNVILEENCDVRELIGCFNTDVISSCIFGLEGNCIENSNSEFREACRRVMTASKFKNTLLVFATTFHNLGRKLHLRLFDSVAEKFFTRLVTDVIKYRKDNNVKRNDLMQIMIELMDQDELNIDDVIGNSFIFFFSGFESSTQAISLSLYQLALNKDIQETARKEIEKVLGKDGKITFENLNSMHYIEKIIQETLRMFPPVASLHRTANSPYTLPNGSTIPKGTFLIIPALGFHFDSDIWPEPERFDPDRFTDDEKEKRNTYAYLPFGEGPRMCIAHKFAMMQVKVGLVSILRNFQVDVTAKTEIPVRMDNAQPVYVPRGSIWLKLSEI